MRLTALISGRVQGVGYRRFVQRHALDLRLAGYAENLRDGRVEVVAEGDRDDLDRLLHWLHRGPAHAKVHEVEVTWNDTTGLSDFFVY